MPIAPPPPHSVGVSAHRHQFDPEYLTDDDVEDLATFTGMSRDECRDRVVSYSTEEHAKAWKEAAPKSASDIVAFYRSTDLYVWELMQWHASESRRPYWDVLVSFAQSYPPSEWSDVFEFGSGVGTDALFLATHGYQVTLCDVDGPTFEFAKHRFRRRGLDATFITSEGPPTPPRLFDAALCLDVFEHLTDPLGAAASLVDALRPGGVLMQRAHFDTEEGNHPCHLEGNIDSFAGLRWNIALTGLGLVNVHNGLIYEKRSGIASLVARSRYAFWRATGYWLTRIPR